MFFNLELLEHIFRCTNETLLCRGKPFNFQQCSVCENCCRPLYVFDVSEASLLYCVRRCLDIHFSLNFSATVTAGNAVCLSSSYDFSFIYLFLPHVHVGEF